MRPTVKREADQSRRRAARLEHELVDAALHNDWIYTGRPGRVHVDDDQDVDDQVAERIEMKVHLPTDLRLKLYGIKLLHGQSISTSVQIALERYFERHRST